MYEYNKPTETTNAQKVDVKNLDLKTIILLLILNISIKFEGDSFNLFLKVIIHSFKSKINKYSVQRSVELTRDYLTML